MRTLLEKMVQALVDAQATAHIGAAPRSLDREAEAKSSGVACVAATR